jgi:hypothetical protein
MVELGYGEVRKPFVIKYGGMAYPGRGGWILKGKQAVTEGAVSGGLIVPRGTILRLRTVGGKKASRSFHVEH